MEEMDVEVARPRQVRYQAALRPDIAALLSLVHRRIEVGFPIVRRPDCLRLLC